MQPTNPTYAPRGGSRRTFVLACLPLALLVAWALITNLGGGAVARNANAAAVTVSATVTSNAHITGTPCAGAIAFGSLGAAATASQTCTVAFGSTNSSSTLSFDGNGSTSLGWTGFAAQGTSCAAASAGAIGIATTTASTATRSAPYNCAAAAFYQIPSGSTPACTATAGADVNCVIAIGVNTGTVSPGAKTGTLNITVA